MKYRFQINRYCKLQSIQNHILGCWKRDFDKIVFTYSQTKRLNWIYGWTRWQPAKFRRAVSSPSIRTWVDSWGLLTTRTANLATVRVGPGTVANTSPTRPVVSTEHSDTADVQDSRASWGPYEEADTDSRHVAVRWAIAIDQLTSAIKICLFTDSANLIFWTHINIPKRSFVSHTRLYKWIFSLGHFEEKQSFDVGPFLLKSVLVWVGYYWHSWLMKLSNIRWKQLIRTCFVML